MPRTLLLLTCCLAACSSGKPLITERVERVGPADFAGAAAALETNPQAATTAEANHDVDDVTFDDARFTPTLEGTPLAVEGLVGQVNGRPIFADEVLSPIEDELRAEALRLTPTAFADKTLQLVQNQMWQIIINDLFLSEARASMSTEQQLGLLSFMRRMRENMVSAEGGSRSRMEQRLRTEEGQSVDEYLEFRQQQVLIDGFVRDKINPRVAVTWRDIERAWTRHRGRYESAGAVTLGWIHLPREGAEEEVAAVISALDRGESFADVADAAGMSDGGRWDTFEMGDGGVSDIAVAPAIKEHLSGMSTGAVRGPIEAGSSVVWVSVLEVREPKTGSLYDPAIQLELRRMLQQQRFMEEQDRFIRSLMDRGSYDAIDSMTRRVALIAVSRYTQ